MCRIGDRWVVNPSGGLESKGKPTFTLPFKAMILFTVEKPMVDLIDTQKGRCTCMNELLL